MEEEDYIIATWVQENVETLYKLLNDKKLAEDWKWQLKKEFCEK